MEKYDAVTLTHVTVRKCVEKGCLKEGKQEETSRYTCWCCGSSLVKV